MGEEKDDYGEDKYPWLPEEVLPTGIPIDTDFLPREEAEFRKQFLEALANRMPEFLRRIELLPDLIVERGPYVALLLQARQVFILGYCYACVAMCGIAAERIVKDRFRSAIRVEVAGKVAPPETQALDQLERIDTSALARFVWKAGILSERGYSAADSLCQLRNKYTHARGENPEADALSAINFLHIIVNETVGVSLGSSRT